MPSAHVHKSRSYTGADGLKRHVVTMTVKTVARCRIVPLRKEAGVRPLGSRKRQASRGQVYVWEPTDSPCGCVRHCEDEFNCDNVHDDHVIEARRPLYDTTLSKAELREALKQNWKELLVMPDRKPVCLTMACQIFACSRAKMFPSTHRRRRSRAEANSHRGNKSVSIAAWFVALMKIVEVMPDQGWYQLQHARRNLVWADYEADCITYPAQYILCKPQLFYKV